MTRQRVIRAALVVGLVAGALVAAVVAGETPAQAAPVARTGLTVAPAGDASPCARHAGFTSIQSAVDAAVAGETISICPGTYQEYVFIPSTLGHLTLKGKGGIPGPGPVTAPVIEFPTTPNTTALTALHADSLVTVDGATGVSIDGLQIAGPFTDTGCEGDASGHYGVYVGGGGQATLTHDYVTGVHVADLSLGGCQDGFGIGAGNSFFFSHSYAPDAGAVTVEHTVVDNYQKDGILIDGGAAAPASVVQDDTVTGVGPTSVIGSNGVEMDDGSAGVIEHNSISGNQYTPVAYQASGILLYQPGANVTVSKNTLALNDLGIYLYDPGTGSSVTKNRISSDVTNPDSEGIQLDSVTGGTVSYNAVSGGAYGIDVFDGTTGTTVSSNTVSSVADVGILDQGTVADTPSSYAGPAASANTYGKNRVIGSGQSDCRDDTTGAGTAGTSNTWSGDRGAHSSPTGLCRP